MKAIIVGRDAALIEPLADRLTRAGLTVIVSENSNSVLAAMKKFSVEFVVADTSLLIEQKLARELVKRFPLIRLVGFSARPNLPGMIEALAEGLIDYFPRTEAYCDAVVEVILSERRRLARWQSMLLTDGLAPGD